ncbi:MAG: squalene/phytoene synthase family protein [Deltaproteobacteria bacterium]|nr:squalene/phytoene synthase family protein [Deltaproteobacteria bacterium]
MNLKKILKGVSRSFYLSLILLPKKIRLQMGLAFLACKAADTIADTELIPAEERLKLLDAYRELFADVTGGNAHSIAQIVLKPRGGSSSEKALIENLDRLMSALRNLDSNDWLLIQELVLELTQGMQRDLSHKTCETLEELNEYTYYVAGCVGIYWTKMMKAHFPFGTNFGKESEALGEKLGKGLQLVNILRDRPQDLKKGRHYIPSGVPLSEIFVLARKYLGEYEKYCDYFPWYACRLKAVVRLPARLGFKTLDLLSPSLDGRGLGGRVIKVSRLQVYQTLLVSFFR